jgi:hypothetical protein
MPRQATIAQCRDNIGLEGIFQDYPGQLKMLKLTISNIFSLIYEKIYPSGYHHIQPSLRANVP